LIPLPFEDDHHDDEDDLVPDFGVSFSVERLRRVRRLVANLKK
jgi:hypothetical protein